MSSSPRAIDIYSHCAMSSVFEFAPTNIEHEVFPTDGVSPRGFVRRGQWEDEDDDPLNIASPEEKLEMALEMTECIAALHGFVDGPIAHVDVQLGQFFRGRDGRIKFVDYNRAEPLLYDEKEGRYCRWRAGGPGDGTVSIIMMMHYVKALQSLRMLFPQLLNYLHCSFSILQLRSPEEK